MTTTDRIDIYTRVTDRIITDLEKRFAVAQSVERRPRSRPSHATSDVSRASISRSISSSLLELCRPAGFRVPSGSFQQAKELGGYVRKGEKEVARGLLVEHHKDRRGGGRSRGGTQHFLKRYTVFNAEQVEGLPAPFYALAQAAEGGLQPIEHAEQFFSGTRGQASITRGIERATSSGGTTFSFRRS